MQNTNAGKGTISDVVATADNGNETTNFIDIGINSSGNMVNFFGSLNNGYLFTATEDLLIGTTAVSKYITFLTSGAYKAPTNGCA